MTGEEIVHQAPRTISLASWLSVERLLYGLAVVVGVSLRLWMLGAQPLSPLEASNSWPAWLAANGLSVVDAPNPNSALFYGLQWLLFWAGVNSDGGARFISAVVGTVFIVSPWWWRGWFGRRVALLAAWLLAIDPWLVGFSRMADGASLALLCGILTLAGMSQVVDQPTSVRWKRVTAITAGLLLVSGPMGWNILPVVIWWGWLLYGDLVAAGMLQRQWLLWIGGAAFLGATAWFARLDGVAWIATGVSVWLSQFDGGEAGPLLPVLSGGYDIGWPWLRLWVDAAPLFPLGIAGLAILAFRVQTEKQMNPRLRLMLQLCGGWLLWGVVLCVLPGRSPLALPMVGLPLIWMTAFSLDVLIRNTPRDVDWREIGAVIATLLILVVSGAFWVAALLANRNYDPAMAQATLVISALGVAILIAFGVWANRRDAVWVGAAVLSTLLLLVYIRSGWKLNYANLVTEPAGWQATMSHPEIQLLAEDMETLSAHRAGDPYQLPVQVQVAPYVTGDDQVVPARPDPVVGWELRHMRNLTWVTSPHVDADSVPLPLVLTPASADGESAQLDLPTEYAGSRYHVDSWWLPRALTNEGSEAASEGESNVAQEWAARVRPWWRWVIYREVTVPPQNRDIVLWAPLDSTTEQ